MAGKKKNKLCEDCNKKQAICGFITDMKARWCTSCSKANHPGTENVKHKRCVDCKTSFANWGFPEDNIINWCGKCARENHKGAINLRIKRCEDCKIVTPTYGMKDKKPRWCKDCSSNHPGAFDVKHPMCEICHETRPCFGYADDKKLRWCYICSQTLQHEKPVINLVQIKCEDCKIISATYGIDNIIRWCSGCAKKYEGAFDVKSKMCEDCNVVHPTYGTIEDKRRRWCTNCAKNHNNSIKVLGLCEICGEKNASFGYEIDRKHRWCFNCSPDDPNVKNLVTKRCANPDCVMQSTVAYDKIFCAQCDPNQTTVLRKKEKRVYNILYDALGDKVLIWNKPIGGDKECEGRQKRPDILIHNATFGIIVEVDEDQHKCPSYGGQLCEIKRMNDIMNAYGLPLVFIRYNPDGYKIDDQKQVTTKKRRELKLIESVTYYITKDQIEPTVVYLYYDDITVGHTVPLEKLISYSIEKTKVH